MKNILLGVSLSNLHFKHQLGLGGFLNKHRHTADKGIV